MKNYNIAVIPGDGIGEEITPEGIKALNAVAEITGDFRLNYESFPWGCDYYLEHGKMMADDGLKTLEQFDAIYFGAVGFPSVPDAVSLHGLCLPICQGFRPVRQHLAQYVVARCAGAAARKKRWRY